MGIYLYFYFKEHINSQLSSLENKSCPWHILCKIYHVSLLMRHLLTSIALIYTAYPIYCLFEDNVDLQNLTLSGMAHNTTSYIVIINYKFEKQE